VSILLHEAKALLEVFCLQPIVIGDRQSSTSCCFASWGKIKIHDFTLADQDWIGLMIFKNFAYRTGLDLILSDRTGLRLKNFTFPSSLLSLNNSFSQRSCFIEYYSGHAHMAWSQKFRKSEISPDTGVKNLWKTGPGPWGTF